MGKKKFKKQLIKEMRIAADKLPVYMVKTRMRLTGLEMLEKYPDMKDQAGKPIHQDKTYIVDGYRPRNHFKRMQEIYESEGVPGLNKYIDGMIAWKKKQDKTKAVVPEEGATSVETTS